MFFWDKIIVFFALDLGYVNKKIKLRLWNFVQDCDFLILMQAYQNEFLLQQIYSMVSWSVVNSHD